VTAAPHERGAAESDDDSGDDLFRPQGADLARKARREEKPKEALLAQPSFYRPAPSLPMRATSTSWAMRR
jgi:hypothetical protein